ncbi:MAG: SdrD B-like domain-containing protein [Chloroflexota bacterium]|nr:MAG: hypothetical protein DIU68_03870 [Chloroflexota bacterium]
MTRYIALLLLVSLLATGAASAQTGGQLWVRSFLDRNGNGVRDTGEPFLTSGVSVNLIDSDGVIIASALLDDSPNATNGLVGFQLLPPGEYTVQVTSAEYTPTAGETFTLTVSDTGVPPVIEFGAQPVEAVEAPASTAAEPGGAIDEQQLLLASVGALAVMCGMAALGVVVYVLVLRQRVAGARGMAGMAPAASGAQYTVPDTDRFRPPFRAEEPGLTEETDESAEKQQDS